MRRLAVIEQRDVQVLLVNTEVRPLTLQPCHQSVEQRRCYLGSGRPALIEKTAAPYCTRSSECSRWIEKALGNCPTC